METEAQRGRAVRAWGLAFSLLVTLSPCHLVTLSPCLFGGLSTACLLAAPAARGADGPRDELLRYVPEGVGFCVVLQDLRGHGAAFLASPFLEQLRRSPLGESLGSAR